MEYTVIVILLALLQYLFFMIQCAAARGKGDVKAPATVGDETYERKFRIQCNTLEQLIIFVPAIYAFSFYVSPVWAQILGAVFIAGRFVYSAGYTSDPSKRGPGMMMTMLPNVVLAVGAIIGILIG